MSSSLNEKFSKLHSLSSSSCSSVASHLRNYEGLHQKSRVSFKRRASYLLTVQTARISCFTRLNLESPSLRQKTLVHKRRPIKKRFFDCIDTSIVKQEHDRMDHARVPVRRKSTNKKVAKKRRIGPRCALRRNKSKNVRAKESSSTESDSDIDESQDFTSSDSPVEDVSRGVLEGGAQLPAFYSKILTIFLCISVESYLNLLSKIKRPEGNFISI